MNRVLLILAAVLVVPILLGLSLNESRAEGVVLCANKGGNLHYRGGEPGSCKKNETEVFVSDGEQGPPGPQGAEGPQGPPGEASATCPCFNDYNLRNAYTLVDAEVEVDPNTNLVCAINETGAALVFEFRLTPDLPPARVIYAISGPDEDRPGFDACFFFPDLNTNGNALAKFTPLMSPEENEACTQIIRSWVADLGKNPDADCPVLVEE